MTVNIEDRVLQSMFFLDKTPKSDGTIGEDTAIITETGDYEYAKTEYISDFKPSQSRNPLAREDDAKSLVLNETQKAIDASTLSACHHHDESCEYYSSGDSLSAIDEHYTIQLTPESWLSSRLDPTIVAEYNSKIHRIRVVYEFEKQFKTNSEAVLIDNAVQTQFLPMNDLLDLCIKSQFKKNKKNGNVPGNLIFSGKDDKLNANIDIYLDLDEYPIDFCQCNNDAFMLTQPTINQPWMLKSTLSAIDYSQSYTMKLEQHPIQTVLYKQPSDYEDGAQSYAQALSAKLQYATPLGAIDLFQPQTKVTGIDYNYIVGIDQTGNANNMYDNPTIYFNGDIYGSIYMAKNMFNSLYSMQMSSDNVLQYCRTYCGIQNSQNKVLLKYYDDADYSFNRESSDVDQQSTASKVNFLSGKVPYQKVEYFYPNKMTAQAKHKSNLFSLKIVDSGLDDEAIEAGTVDKSIAQQIKRDIFNGIAALAESIAPANTQFFKTYYKHL